ncbi:MAG: hypothetical protein L0216_14905 [Planctomycetales bacterium]|nr:hypothetical protein [Planctomycetales bacterium]
MAESPAAPTVAAPPPRGALVSPALDFLAVGGLSIVACVALHLVFPPDADLRRLGKVLYWSGLVANWPHFLLSYQLLYWDRRRALLSRPRFVWAGVVAPALLAAALAAPLVAGSPELLGGCVQAMFFLVGWHYVKQAYGCAIVLAAQSGYFLGVGEKAVVRWNLYALWWLGFAAVNTVPEGYVFEGVRYSSLELPRAGLVAGFVAVAATGLAVVAVILRKWRRDGAPPPRNAVVAFLSIHVWFLPVLRHPGFVLMLPFFHGLQYLLFALRFAHGKAAAAEAAGARPWFGFYVGSALVLGALAFVAIPRLLDARLPYDRDRYGPTLALALITLFINIHHYLIDNVIWRRDDPDVRRYLR